MITQKSGYCIPVDFDRCERRDQTVALSKLVPFPWKNLALEIPDDLRIFNAIHGHGNRVFAAGIRLLRDLFQRRQFPQSFAKFFPDCRQSRLRNFPAGLIRNHGSDFLYFPDLNRTEVKLQKQPVRFRIISIFQRNLVLLSDVGRSKDFRTFQAPFECPSVINFFPIPGSDLKAGCNYFAVSNLRRRKLHDLCFPRFQGDLFLVCNGLRG